MKWLTHSLLVLIVVVGLAALVPFFVTLNDYVPTVEKELSTRLGAPVSIDELHGAIFPVPHVRADGIAIGNTQDIMVGRVTLRPDLWSFMRSVKVIRSVDFEDVIVSQHAFGVLAQLAQRDNGAGTLQIERIKLKKALVKLDEGSFGPFDAEVEVGSADKKGAIKLNTQDGTLEARLIPQDDRYALQIAAKGWKPPLGPAIRFDSLDVKGVVGTNGAELTDIQAKLYGGTAAGAATLHWDEGIGIKGQLALKQVELKDAVALVSPKMHVSGRLDADPVFSANAQKADQLDEALRVQTNFSVRDGVLYGLDLPSAVAALTKQGKTGGQTRFEDLSGHLVVERETYRFTQLRIASGPLSAQGNVTIGANKALSGRLTTNVSAAGKAAKVPLVLAGTLDSPTVYPDAAALVGAAAGTLILGPGAGTAAGSTLGEIAEGLFGKKSVKP